MSEEIDIERLEAEFPILAASAFAAARERVLASGQSVLQSEHGYLYEVHPDGSRVAVKKIESPMAVIPGTKITIK